METHRFIISPPETLGEGYVSESRAFCPILSDVAGCFFPMTVLRKCFLTPFYRTAPRRWSKTRESFAFARHWTCIQLSSGVEVLFSWSVDAR